MVQGYRAVDSQVGRIGQLACWEHYNPLARYAMMADGEQMPSAMYPGSIFGDLFSQQTESECTATCIGVGLLCCMCHCLA